MLFRSVSVFDLYDDIYLVGVGVFAPEASIFGGMVDEDERGAGAVPSQGFELGKVEARFGDGVYE